MASRAPRPYEYKARHNRGWRRNRDSRRWIAGGSLEGMLAVIPSMPRPALARIVQLAIDRMDLFDGDPDCEDATNLEDDFTLRQCVTAYSDNGPGCPIADAGGQCDEDGINTTFPSQDGPGCTISDSGGGNVEDEGQINEVQPYTGPISII